MGSVAIPVREPGSAPIPLGKRGVCGGVLRPDIVMFGEDMPKRFIEMQKEDFGEWKEGSKNVENKCDGMLILGTSLTVHPFNQLVELPDFRAPRVLINRDKAGKMKMGFGLRYDEDRGNDCRVNDRSAEAGDSIEKQLEVTRLRNYRDVFLGGADTSCDDVV